MESLDPQCTPLKHRYDSCFNLWFEGYLQPALDGRLAEAPSSNLARDPPVSAQSFAAPSSSTASSSDASPLSKAEETDRRPLITNWSHAFRSRTPRVSLVGTGDETMEIETKSTAVYDATPQTIRSIDKRGKTRSQIKAEEYDIACGQHWRDYQGCLKNAIARNISLSTLLEQAKEEHPLISQEGLGGTAWDPDHGR